ncbi:hypothetical protein A3F37_02870 [Candidatus Saccharibacteria bacterium RIFCSPHIGHO2_12_FULL_41_12]|nr:MAG: hypothetical protein A3F37_02870 [Candidatus Saccharibacteria bacterium RIFCSPHIGHO2_12_FULL_41_12]
MSFSGESYIHSQQKRALELSLLGSGALSIGGLAIVSAVALKLSNPGEPLIIQTERGLIPGQTYQSPKFGNPDSDQVVHRFLAKTMLDEIPQLAEVASGKMTLFGPRADKPSHVEALFESLADDELKTKWLEVKRKQKPGLISSYSVYSHSNNVDGIPEYIREQLDRDIISGAERRAILDIHDFHHASTRHDLSLLRNAFHMAKTNYRVLSASLNS